MTTAEFILKLLDSGVILAIAGVIVKLIQILGDYLTAAITSHLTASQAKQFLALTEKVENIVVTVVAQLLQTTVNTIKEKSEDGKLTTEECLEIKQKAIEQVLNILGDAAKEELQKAFGDVNAYLDAKIEAAVLASKNKPIS